MLGIMLMSATAFIAPMPDSDQLLSSYKRLNTSNSGAALVEIVISADGKLQNCKEIRQFGDDEVSSKVCSILQKVRWRSGTNSDGKPATWQFRHLVKLFSFHSKNAEYIYALKHDPDYTITISKFPEGINDDFRYGVTLTIGEDGKAKDCAGSPFNKGPKRQEITDLSCRVARQVEYAPTLSPDGKAVPFITALTLNFVRATP